VPEIHDDEIIIYVEALFAQTIATSLGRRLLDPPEDWLVTLPWRYSKRRIRCMALKEARQINGSAFVKPPNDKSFQAAVYADGSALPTEFDDEMMVLVAAPIAWGNEYRCFVLNGEVRAVSPYLLNDEHAGLCGYQAPREELAAASRFATEVACDATTNTPAAIVLDVGLLGDNQWAVVEANGAWGSGVYGCDPDGALDVIRAATLPLV
jgi:hypothetical protein